MESFEHVVKVYLESKGYTVSCGVKFPVRLRTKTTTKDGKTHYQRHGYEVDVVAAKHGELLLGSVKSFFGSSGVGRQGFRGLADRGRRTHFQRYMMFNRLKLRNAIIRKASQIYDFPKDQIRLALFVGKFLAADKDDVVSYLSKRSVEVTGPDVIVEQLLTLVGKKTYVNDPVITTLRLLHAQGKLIVSA